MSKISKVLVIGSGPIVIGQAGVPGDGEGVEMSLSEVEKQQLIAELDQFHHGFVRYKTLVLAQKRVIEKIHYADVSENEFKTLSSELQRKYGRLKAVIEEYGGSTEVLLMGGHYKCEAFTSAFSYTPFSEGALIDVMDTAIAAINIAIGNLQSLTLPESVASVETLAPPKAFIAHGGVHFVLDKLKNFLLALGVEPLVVEEQPSADMTVDEKVEFYLGEADCAIIVATADDEIDGKLHPRQNVVHEIGLAQKALPGKIIYLLEQYAEFPSNVRPKVWERFDRTNMESAFIRVAKELKAFGLIRAAKV